MDVPKPPVRGKYSIRNPMVNAAFSAMDVALSMAVPQKTSVPQELPQRILLSNIAHLGDVIMATALLPALKSVYPQAQIGFLVGSWSQSLLQDHPLVDHLHFLDHWAHNRAGITKRRKMQQYLRTRRIALKQIRATGYDTAIDLYWNFPNTLPLLWQAKIPVRIGYESGGFGPLATQSLEFGDKRLHASQRYLDLLKALPLGNAFSDAEHRLQPVLPPLDTADPGVAKFEAALQVAGLRKKEYVVFHTGAADSFRDWPALRWRDLASSLLAEGRTLVFTGTGAADEARVREITDGLTGCINLCSRLPWTGFVAAIAGAQMLVCVDTVAGHVASATDTPCAVLTAGRWPYLWRPLGPKTRVLMSPVPCAPCHRNHGCVKMDCLRDVSVNAVYEAVQALLPVFGTGRTQPRK